MEIRTQTTQPGRPLRAPCRAGRADRPTLLVFTLGAHCESRRRRLLPPTQRAIEDSLHQACLDTTLEAGRDAGLRLEVCSPLELELPADVARRRQDGPDFGSRLQTAVEQTFAEQDGPVVLVGSDIPDLDATHLHHTLEALEDDPECVVIGPSPDGGFYLLAATRPLETAFSAVHWRCRQTLQSLKQALRHQGRRIVLLPTLADLDRRSDLEHWLAARRHTVRGIPSFALWRSELWRGLISRLTEIFADLRLVWLPEFQSASPRLSWCQHRLRGPPVPAALA